ncbi:NAD(P)/FAD-dependent oxidoreductase [soil metagenome]
MVHKAAIIGGGAAGFFAAIRLAELNPDLTVCIYEKSTHVLGKVKVSGGGRCNVTHHCLDPKELIKYYPRGSKELLGPLNKFGPTDTINWFQSRGVALKTEPDGRMFPITDSSQTILDCLMQAATDAGVEVRTRCGVEEIKKQENGTWILTLQEGETKTVDILMLATGSSERSWQMLRKMGVKMEPASPSLFTFNIKDNRIDELPGVSFPQVKVKVEGTKLEAEGPLLITHWGMSGPAILKISAWGARDLQAKEYKFWLKVNFIPEFHEDSAFDYITQCKGEYQRKKCGAFSPFESVPKRFWYQMMEAAGIEDDQIWAVTTKQQIRKLAIELTNGRYVVEGKSTNKDEFVTCGGIQLAEIDFKTMAIKKIPNLFVAGEMIDVDALTGGFNFQNAWTTGWIAGTSMSEQSLLKTATDF